MSTWRGHTPERLANMIEGNHTWLRNPLPGSIPLAAQCIRDQAEQISALEAEIERMREPDIYWLVDDPETSSFGIDALAMFHDLASGVHPVTCAAELPARWIAVETIDKWVTDPTGLFGIHYRGETHVTEHLSNAAAAAAALLTTQEGEGS